jgi:hypothetical protein
MGGVDRHDHSCGIGLAFGGSRGQVSVILRWRNCRAGDGWLPGIVTGANFACCGTGGTMLPADRNGS